MNLCIAGKNRIAVEVADYVKRYMPEIRLYALTNKNDTGVDTWQPSFLKYIHNNSDIITLTTLQNIYSIKDLVFLSLEYDRIINPTLFQSKRLFNIHFSLLPQYKGVYTSAWPILNGEKESGVTLHKIDKGIDTGEIICQQKIPLTFSETAESLYIKYINTGIQLVLKELDALIHQDCPNSYPQPAIDSSYYSKKSIDYNNASVDYRQTAAQIDRWVRAMYFPAFQYPKIFGYQIVKTEITCQRSVAPPGTIIVDEKDCIELATIDYNIILYKRPTT